ncbi:MAG: multiheme c-type cytochrome [Pseudomonas sp.]|nr:multiheme c-type cytochrome [Pseudomonas sp.]
MPTKKQHPGRTDSSPHRTSHNLIYSLIAGLAVVAVIGLWWFIQAPPPAPVVVKASAPAAAARPVPPPAAQWVDESTCQGCHVQQVKDWQGSHHQMAMQAATPATVLGDFKDVTFKGDKEAVRFFEKDQAFWVNTPGANGQPADFKVAYTFGVAPLQQYLLEAEGGRLQALGVAWDTEHKRWFHLYPGQGVNFKNPLHWSKPSQNANFMCVECHTTGFKRNFDAASNTFASHWNSLGVGCQACHGPASNHLAWAAKQSPVANAGFEVNLAAKDATSEIETCARCHARRAPLDDGYANKNRLMDDYLPATLTRELYALDGKIKEEVFEDGSFKQSKMFDKGVRCSNCHNPHSSELKASGNGVCLQCHNTAGKTPYDTVDGRGLQAKNYDSPEHTHHQPGQPGSQCVDCHMPGKLYMVNDYRHDHGFSLPNPARAQKLGTPDACLGCHQDTAASKVSEQFRLWYGVDKPQPPRYDEGLWLIRGGQPGAAQALTTLLQQNNLPAIRRATLLAEVPTYPTPLSLKLVGRDLQNPAPQVRESAVHALSALVEPMQRSAYLVPLLSDPVRAVRIAAARDLLNPGLVGLGAAQPAWDSAIAEYEAVQKALAERAEANLNLAMFYQASGRSSEVEPALRAAIVRDPDFLPATVALGQWLDNHGRGSEATTLLDQAVKAHPESGLLLHTRALRLIRAKQMPEAIASLRQAATLEPDNVQYSFVLAIALHDSGQLQPANDTLQAALARHPANRDLRLTLAQYYQEQGKGQAARQLLQALAQINPDDPVLQPPPK